MGTWTNSDGLYIKFGTDEATVGKGGEYRTNTSLREVELEITLSGLTTTGVVQSDTVSIPNGYRIEEVEVFTETAATSGGAATLDIGLIDQDRSTSFDDDGLVAAMALTAIDTAGEKSVLRVGSTGVGALVGTTLSNTGLIVASYNTAAFTAGKVVVRVRFYKP
jgi:hypothetical protein